jgi:cytochrome c-type biogenesis protein CcmH/NrfG
MWDGAAVTFRLINIRLPNLADAYLGLGRALEANAEVDGACGAYRRCIELAPDNPAADKAKARLEAIEDP